MAKPFFSIKFDMPAEVINGFPKFVGTLRRHIVRQALRSALLPSRNSLKSKLMALPRESKQSSGATYRALVSKYKNARNNPDRFYGIIGVNNKYIEATTLEKSPLYAKAIQRQVSFGIRQKRTADDGSVIYSKRYPRGDVRSRLRKKVFGPKSVGGLKKRWPARYLHLWEAGFTHARSGKAFTGHQFFAKTKEETQAKAKEIFRTKVLEHFRKAFGK
jgi:hypothetical protein